MLSRRKLLAAAAPVAAVAIAGCSNFSTNVTQVQQQIVAGWTTFVDDVNSALQTTCQIAPGFIATAQTIELIVNVLYPSISAALAAGTAAIQSVAASLCAAVPANPPASLVRKLQTHLKGVSPAVYIGNVTVNGNNGPVVVPVHGWGVQK